MDTTDKYISYLETEQIEQVPQPQGRNQTGTSCYHKTCWLIWLYIDPGLSIAGIPEIAVDDAINCEHELLQKRIELRDDQLSRIFKRIERAYEIEQAQFGEHYEQYLQQQAEYEREAESSMWKELPVFDAQVVKAADIMEDMELTDEDDEKFVPPKPPKPTQIVPKPDAGVMKQARPLSHIGELNNMPL